MTSLRWGFLSTCGPHDVHVLNVLDRICPVSVIFRPEREPENIKTESKHEILSVWKNYNEEKRKKRLLDLGEFVLENLHTKESFTVPIQPVDIPTAIIKSDEFHNYLQEYNLDLLFVSSAPILSEKAFTTPSLGSINLHYGFVPNYRGEHTLVWPFMERD